MSRHLAIVGGGCAGLSLATALVRGNYPGRVTVIEPRSEYVDDRTWCAWGVATHPFRHLVSKSWNRWRVLANGSEVESVTRRFPYQCIRSGDFYREAMRVLGNSSRCEVMLGCSVETVTTAQGLQVIKTTRGELVADQVYDSRPLARTPGLQQHFEGWRVRSHAPVFDPGSVTLMDFSVDQSRGIHFFYVLPFSETEGLVEATFMTPEVFSGDEYAPLIREYLRRLGVGEYEVTFRERGVIPMSPAATERARPGYQRIGVAGGMLRSSTGYAFLSIQQATQRLAAQILAGRVDARGGRKDPILHWLDRVFLRVLQDGPENAPQLFEGLFRRCPPNRLVNFLHRPRPGLDWVRPLLSVPTGPFLGAAWRNAFHPS